VSLDISARFVGFVTNDSVHGYSLLRPTLNVDYFHDLYDVATDFGIEVEGHRELLVGP
jgi:hypothetical protein